MPGAARSSTCERVHVAQGVRIGAICQQDASTTAAALKLVSAAHYQQRQYGMLLCSWLTVLTTTSAAQTWPGTTAAPMAIARMYRHARERCHLFPDMYCNEADTHLASTALGLQLREDKCVKSLILHRIHCCSHELQRREGHLRRNFAPRKQLF